MLPPNDAVREAIALKTMPRRQRCYGLNGLEDDAETPLGKYMRHKREVADTKLSPGGFVGNEILRGLSIYVRVFLAQSSPIVNPVEDQSGTKPSVQELRKLIVKHGR